MAAGPVRVDRSGNGRILGVSLATRGEAIGHGFELDDQAIDAVVEQGEGAKVRWTHGNLCDDGLGRHLGRVENLRRVGPHAVGDLVFSASAHRVRPDGLTVSAAQYLLARAEEEPDTLGLSIVFEGEVDELEGGRSVARIAKLSRADVVADPAANPLGLFAGTGSELSAAATAQLDEVVEELGRDRVLEFCLSYWGRKGVDLQVKPKKKPAKKSGAKVQLMEPPMGEEKGQEGAAGNGQKARSKIREAEDLGYTHEEIGQATDRSASVVGAIKSGEIQNPPDDFLEKIDALIAKGPKEPPAESGEESMSSETPLASLAALANENARLREELAKLTDKVAELRAREIESYVEQIAQRTAELNAPAERRDLDRVRELMEAGADDMARKLGDALLRAAELSGGPDFTRAADDKPKSSLAKANEAAARLLRARGYKVELDESGQILNATLPGKGKE